MDSATTEYCLMGMAAPRTTATPPSFAVHHHRRRSASTGPVLYKYSLKRSEAAVEAPEAPVHHDPTQQSPRKDISKTIKQSSCQLNIKIGVLVVIVLSG